MPTPQTVKVYLAAICHMQITLGLPEPIEYSLMPRLQLYSAIRHPAFLFSKKIATQLG